MGEKVEKTEFVPKEVEETFMLLDGPENKIVAADDIPEDLTLITETETEEMKIVLDENIDAEIIPQEKILALVAEVMKHEAHPENKAVFIEQEETSEPDKVILKAVISDISKQKGVEDEYIEKPEMK